MCVKACIRSKIVEILAAHQIIYYFRYNHLQYYACKRSDKRNLKVSESSAGLIIEYNFA